MWSEYITIVVLAMLLRMRYELSQADNTMDNRASNVAMMKKAKATPALISQLAEKSVRGYARAQEKKWRNWAQSLSK